MKTLIASFFMNTLFALIFSLFGTGEDLVSEVIKDNSSSFVSKVVEKKLNQQELSYWGEVTAPCNGPLDPLHIHQREKIYHLELSVRFNRKLPGPSLYCQVPQRVTPKCRPNRISPDQSLAECLWEHQRCLGPKTLKIKVLSDLYKDSCGNTLRGFALIDYGTPGEKMEDSVSPGHTLELVQRFSSGGQYKPGPSSPVPQDRFLFFIDPKS